MDERRTRGSATELFLDVVVLRINNGLAELAARPQYDNVGRT
jgi:hypothetical protein